MPTSSDDEKSVLMRFGEGGHAVRVVAPARLHLGFIDLNGSLGRRYGSLGLAIERPHTEVVSAPAAQMAATGFERQRALTLVRQLSEAVAFDGAISVDIRHAIPAHAGLGSGTQLALAIGASVLALAGKDRTPTALASLAGRGARSAIGMAAFEHGGFIVDGGRGSLDTPPPMLMRLPFPDDWRVLLVLDHRTQGVHGDRESAAFAALRPFPEHLAGHLARLVLMRLGPGLVERDLAAFGAAVTEIQTIVGAHFAAAQGGSPWSSPAVGEIVAKFAAEGATGIGQSSWGPTGFAFVDSEHAAQRLYQSTAEAARREGLEIVVARGRNVGARVEQVTTADQET